jgi:hypothetical protein
MLVNIEVTFNGDGTANIRLPEGKLMKNLTPAKVAELTEKLAKAMGPIIERHAAHSHVHLDASSGKIVSDEHVHE